MKINLSVLCENLLKTWHPATVVQLKECSGQGYKIHSIVYIVLGSGGTKGCTRCRAQECIMQRAQDYDSVIHRAQMSGKHNTLTRG